MTPVCVGICVSPWHFAPTYCVTPLKAGAKYEIALPCTEPPIIVQLEILRVLSKEKNLYACQFIDLLPQEEAMVQESIFEYDLYHHTA